MVYSEAMAQVQVTHAGWGYGYQWVWVRNIIPMTCQTRVAGLNLSHNTTHVCITTHIRFSYPRSIIIAHTVSLSATDYNGHIWYTPSYVQIHMGYLYLYRPSQPVKQNPHVGGYIPSWVLVREGSVVHTGVPVPLPIYSLQL